MASNEPAVNQGPTNGPSAAYRGGGEAFSHSNSLALLAEAATAAIQAELDAAEREAEAILEHGQAQAEGIRQRVDAQAREINERAERQVREILARADRDAQELLQRARAEAEAAEQAARVRAQEIRVQAEARLWARLESIRPGVAQERGIPPEALQGDFERRPSGGGSRGDYDDTTYGRYGGASPGPSSSESARYSSIRTERERERAPSASERPMTEAPRYSAPPGSGAADTPRAATVPRPETGPLLSRPQEAYDPRRAGSVEYTRQAAARSAAGNTAAPAPAATPTQALSWGGQAAPAPVAAAPVALRQEPSRSQTEAPVSAPPPSLPRREPEYASSEVAAPPATEQRSATPVQAVTPSVEERPSSVDPEASVAMAPQQSRQGTDPSARSGEEPARLEPELADERPAPPRFARRDPEPTVRESTDADAESPESESAAPQEADAKQGQVQEESEGFRLSVLPSSNGRQHYQVVGPFTLTELLALKQSVASLHGVANVEVTPVDDGIARISLSTGDPTGTLQDLRNLPDFPMSFEPTGEGQTAAESPSAQAASTGDEDDIAESAAKRLSALAQALEALKSPQRSRPS